MSLFRKKEFLLKEHQNKIVAAIQAAEKETSGEIRVFVESRCKQAQAIDRAREIFLNLKMEKTQLRNGVLIYVALKDHKSAILGDKGIYEMTGGPQFWENTLEKMHHHFRNKSIVEGIMTAIEEIGNALSHHFPYDPGTDKNELPDNIVFGK